MIAALDDLEARLPVPPKARVKLEDDFNQEEADLLAELLDEAPTREPIVRKKKPELAGGGSDDEEALRELEASLA